MRGVILQSVGNMKKYDTLTKAMCTDEGIMKRFREV